MTSEFILLAVLALQPKTVTTKYIKDFSTITACEQAAQVLRQGNTVGGINQEYVCVKSNY